MPRGWLRLWLCGLCGCLLWPGGEVQSQRHGFRSYTFTGKVVSVADGDTVGVRSRGQYHILRLFGIDTPEKRQLDGPAATAFTRRFAMGKRARVKVVDRDRYGRLVSVVIISGKSLNEALLAAGWAWHYKRFSKSRRFAALERQARRARRGIWRRANPQAPWDWRRQQYRRRGSRRYRRGYRRYRRYRRGYRRYNRRYRRYNRRYHRRYNRYRHYKQRRRPRGDEGRGSSTKAPRHSRPRRKGPLFHGNVVSGVYHHPRCGHYRCRNCVVQLHSTAEAHRLGYRPHRSCTSRP